MKSKFVAIIQQSLDDAVKVLSLGNRGTCKINGCVNHAIAKGLCNAHYIRARRGKDLSKPVQPKVDNCIECQKPSNGKGGWMRCAKHFKIARQKTIKAAIVNAMGGACQRCGGVFSLPVYDFHHVGKKDGNPSELISNASIEKIADEMEKCILLCANCHRVEHETEL